MTQIDTNTRSLGQKVELLVFLLDGSGSMGNEKDGAKNTYDGRTKSEHLFDIAKESLFELSRSDRSPVFRVSIVYFAGEATTEEVEISGQKTKYFYIDSALSAIKNPFSVASGNGTSIIKAIDAVEQVLDLFQADIGLPSHKSVTIFLFTDGQENNLINNLVDDSVNQKERCRNRVNTLRAHATCPTIATISLGTDADEELLKDIASPPNPNQIRHLDMAGVLGELLDQQKLFLRGNAQGLLTEKSAMAIRRFVDTLSTTSDQQTATKQEKI